MDATKIKQDCITKMCNGNGGYKRKASSLNRQRPNVCSLEEYKTLWNTVLATGCEIQIEMQPRSSGQFKVFWYILIAEAEKVPSDHEAHTPISDILKDCRISALAWNIFQWTSLHTRDKRRDKLSFQFIVNCFGAVGVDLFKFRPDLADVFEKWELSCFLHMAFIYTVRNKQGACAKCGMLILDHLFGAVGYESNHYADDNAESDEERTKSFCICSSEKGRSFVSILFECPKTRLECWKCHNHFGPNLYDSLPNECFGVYIYAPRPYHVVQSSFDCKKLYETFRGLIGDQVTTYSYEYIVQQIIDSDNTFFVDHRDCLLFDKDTWNRIQDKSSRNTLLKRAYLQAEKRLAGGCFMCLNDFANGPLRQLGGLDGHHVDESNKSFDPSKGVHHSLEIARSEHSKCFPLCKRCHLLITHTESDNQEFQAKMSSFGYDIDENGQIYTHKSGPVRIQVSLKK